MIKQISLNSIDYYHANSSNTLFANYSLTLYSTSIHVIHGRSGSGKSTLIKLLSGLLAPKSGSINILLKENSELSFSYHNLGAQGFLQTQSCLVSQFIEYENFSVQEYIKFGLTNQSNTHSEINASLTIFDANFRLDDKLLNMGMNQLSGGQRKMLSLAKVMLINRPLLLLDEPTSGVDVESRVKIYEAIARISAKKFVIFSTHDNSYLDSPPYAKFNQVTLN